MSVRGVLYFSFTVFVVLETACPGSAPSPRWLRWLRPSPPALHPAAQAPVQSASQVLSPCWLMNEFVF